MTNIPHLDFKVDKERWGDPFDPTDKDQLTTENISGYIACMTVIYQSRKYKDNALWQIFHEDFEGFTTEIFSRAHRQALRDLRAHLESQGVWVKDVKGSSYAKVLQACLEERDPHVWTETEIKERDKTIQNSSQPFQQQVQPPLQPPLQPPQLSYHLNQSQPPPAQPQQLPYQLHQPYRQFPIPERGDNGNTQAKLLTDLMKIYNNDDKKYSGEEYDILDIKLQVFYDCCSKIGLPETQYHYAYSIMLKGRASIFYYDKIAGRSYDFQTMVAMTKTHFETEENHQKYLSEWRKTTLIRTISENPGKSRLECLQIIIDKLQKVQQGPTKEYQYEHNLRDQVINACRGVEECNLALYKPANTFEGVCAELRSAIGTAVRSRESTSAFNAQADDNEYEYNQNWTDCTYRGRGRSRGRGFGTYRGQGNRRGSTYRRGNTYEYQGNRNRGFQQKKCYVCDQPGCWSTKHTTKERQKAYEKFRQQASYTTEQDVTPQFYSSFLAQYEGLEGIVDTTNTEPNADQFMTMRIDDAPYDTYLTELGEINGIQTVSILNDQSAYHAFTRDDVFQLIPLDEQPPVSSTFTFNDRYSSYEFHGIMPDSGAAGISSAGESQLLALQKRDPSIQLDTSTARSNRIRFGKGITTVKGIVRVPTPLGIITFYVVPTNILFLLCLQDIDAIGVRFDNLKNVLI